MGDIGWYSMIKTFRKVDGILATHQRKRKHQESKETGSEQREPSKVTNTKQTTESVAPLVRSTGSFVCFIVL
jgi:hypothetical protein